MGWLCDDGQEEQRAYDIWTACIAGALASKPCRGNRDIIYAWKDIRAINFECNTVPLSHHLMPGPGLILCFTSLTEHCADGTFTFNVQAVGQRWLAVLVRVH